MINLKRVAVVEIIVLFIALLMTSAGCTYQTGSKTGRKNAPHINIRLPLSRLFGSAVKISKAATNGAPGSVLLIRELAEET